MDTMEPAILTAISIYSQQYKLPANLVRAICHVESSFDTWAMRHERSYRWLVGDKLTMSDTERIGQMTSFGLMQVMGATARELGYTGPFPKLCDPSVGVEYGCKYLARLHQRYENWPDTVASYNAGQPTRLADGHYLNQGYVDKVYRHWTALDHQDQLT